MAPYNGSGTYSSPSLPGTWNPAQSGGTADPTDFNTLRDDLATALSTAICKDGQTTVTANIPMNAKKFTGLAAGTGAGDSVRFEQVLPPTGSTLAALLRGYLSGVAISRASATTIGVAAGVAMDDTNVQMIPVAAAVTINCAVTGALGLDAGALAINTWYHVFVIAKTDGTVSALASTSIGAPTYPTGYTLKRRIGSFRTNGSAQVTDFVQDGDLFQWLSPVGDVSAANPGTLAVTRTLTVPTGVAVQAIVQLIVQNVGTAGLYQAAISDLATTDTAVNAGNSDTTSAATTAGGAQQGVTRLVVRTNTSAQIRSRLSGSDASTTLIINTLGWIDRRGRDA